MKNKINKRDILWQIFKILWPIKISEISKRGVKAGKGSITDKRINSLFPYNFLTFSNLPRNCLRHIASFTSLMKGLFEWKGI